MEISRTSIKGILIKFMLLTTTFTFNLPLSVFWPSPLLVSASELNQDKMRIYKQESEEVASKAKTNLNDYFIDSSIKNREINQIIGYQPNYSVSGYDLPLEQAESMGEIKRSGTYSSNNLNNTSSICNKVECDVSANFNSKAINFRETQTEEAGFTKDADGNLRNIKGYLDKALKTVSEADEKFDYLKGGYADCESKDELITIKSEEICEEYYHQQEQTCMPEQVVEIDPKYNYMCSKKRDIREKICTDSLTSLKCRENKECNAGGIVAASIKDDMIFSYNYPNLILGPKTKDHWRPTEYCEVYERNTIFNIGNLNQIKEFRIVRIEFDDYIQISINEHTIFVGPDGGDRLEVVSHKTMNGQGRKFDFQSVYNGITNSPCERSTDWDVSVNIDLKPYLREGENILFTKVIVSGIGEGTIYIRAEQQCCNKWDEIREERCFYS